MSSYSSWEGMLEASYRAFIEGSCVTGLVEERAKPDLNLYHPGVPPFFGSVLGGMNWWWPGPRGAGRVRRVRGVATPPPSREGAAAVLRRCAGAPAPGNGLSVRIRAGAGAAPAWRTSARSTARRLPVGTAAQGPPTQQVSGAGPTRGRAHRMRVGEACIPCPKGAGPSAAEREDEGGEWCEWYRGAHGNVTPGESQAPAMGWGPAVAPAGGSRNLPGVAGRGSTDTEICYPSHEGMWYTSVRCAGSFIATTTIPVC
jgi:hypothetical protein